MPYQTPLSIKDVLRRIENRQYVIPAIQREFVWSPSQMCGLFDSLLRGYPIGTFLFWPIEATESRKYSFYSVMCDYHERKNPHSQVVDIPPNSPVTAILDGQQRLTSLNIGLNGSYAARRFRASSADQYPVTRMHLDLTHVPDAEDEGGIKYLFRFLTEHEAARSSEHNWYLAADAMRLEGGPDINNYIRRAGLGEHPTAYETLDRLWEAVTRNQSISFFDLEKSELGEVLDIFIRVNSGGTTLSKSDLLLSVATAQFTKRDARETIYGLVDDLNETGKGFSFNKDLVLKAGLLLTDRTSVIVTPASLTPEALALIDDSWDRIDTALRNAVRLLDAFGFSEKNLPAASIIYPIAAYLDRRQLGYEYITSETFRHDRELLRRWVMRMLIAPGIWGSDLNKLITRMRSVIREHGAKRFPDSELEDAAALMGKSLALTRDQIEQLVDTKARVPRAFVLLSLLYPGTTLSNELHVDHIFPKKLFTAKQLSLANVAPELVGPMRDASDRLANLQLLRGSVNASKQAEPPMEWARSRFPDPNARHGYLAENDMHDLPDDIGTFLEFYEARRARMVGRLAELLHSPQAADRQNQATETDDPLETKNEGGVRQVSSRDSRSVVEGSNLGSSAARPLIYGPTPRHQEQERARIRTSYGRSLANVEEGPVEFRAQGTVYRGWIKAGGLTLDDGRTFFNPSAAARAVNGDSPVNGWQAWKRSGIEIRDLHP